jgi:hypothetical protein
MKWLEPQFVVNGKTFTILGLELFYPASRISSVLLNMNDHVRELLRFQLKFDFVFMVAVYPGIAALCVKASSKASTRLWKKILIILACLQSLAWVCDILENLTLFKWIEDPSGINNIGTYHFIVITKWLIATLAVIIAVPFVFRKRTAANNFTA